MANRFNPYYNRTNTCDNIKEDGYKCKEKLYRHAHREYNEKGNWTGRWLCGKCWGRNYQRNDSRSGNNLIKSMTNCRTKDLYNKYFQELSYRDIGRIGEDIVSLTLGLRSQNDLIDNYNSLFDIEVHHKYGRIQVKIASLGIRRLNWQFDIGDIWIERGFDTLIVLCMDENQPWKIVERVYIISMMYKELSVQKIDIYKNTPRVLSKWEKFRIDERPYDSTYQKMRKIYNALKGDDSI